MRDYSHLYGSPRWYCYEHGEMADKCCEGTEYIPEITEEDIGVNIFTLIDNCDQETSGITKNLDDTYNLIDRLNAFGKFATAEIMEEWYNRMKYHISLEHGAFSL